MQNEMISVGIDLGTSTTQMVLSKLTIKNMASAFTIPRVEITDKEIIYKSDIIFTPLVDESHIDVEKIKEFLTHLSHKLIVFSKLSSKLLILISYYFNL